MRQTGTLGNARRAAGVDDQGQILGRVDGHRRRLGLGLGNHVVEKQVAGLVFRRLGDLPQQTADNPLELGQVGLDAADDHRLDAGGIDGLRRGGVEIRVVHAENGLGAAVLELEVEFLGGVEGVAGHADGAGLEDPEINGRIVRQVRKKNSHAVALSDSPCMQEMGDPVGGVPDLREGPGGIAENGVNVVGVGPGRVVQYGEKRFVEPGD